MPLEFGQGMSADLLDRRFLTPEAKRAVLTEWSALRQSAQLSVGRGDDGFPDADRQKQLQRLRHAVFLFSATHVTLLDKGSAFLGLTTVAESATITAR